MSVYCIVERVQYKYLYLHHHVLPLSLACRIMFHWTQNHPLSNLVAIQLRFCIPPSTVFCFAIPASVIIYFMFISRYTLEYHGVIYYQTWVCYTRICTSTHTHIVYPCLSVFLYVYPIFLHTLPQTITSHKNSALQILVEIKWINPASSLQYIYHFIWTKIVLLVSNSWA